MAKAGQYATHCKRGHELTPENRRPTQRGLGTCRQCYLEGVRRRRGSAKTGPASPFSGDEVARLAAVAEGLKRCCRCHEAKPFEDFSRDRNLKDGLSPRCRACKAAGRAAHYAKNGAMVRARTTANKLGIPVEHLLMLRVEQQNLCAVCHRVCPSGNALALDHDHRTGRVRGLLCAPCNMAIGQLQDSPTVVEAAAAYLRKWNADEGHDASV